MLKGSFVALVTPFENHKVDFDSLEDLINMHVKNGTDGIVVCGSTGEGVLLSNEERDLIIEKSVEFAKKRIFVVVGCSFASTESALEAVLKAQHFGADAALVLVPFYVKPTQQGIVQHFSYIHHNSNIPIIMYNNPARCSVNMGIEAITSLAKMKRIVALKDSCSDMARLEQIREKNRDLILLSGDDLTLLKYLRHGGDGAISVVANIFPREIKDLIEACKNGKLDIAKKINKKMEHIIDCLLVESNPIPIKYAMLKKKLIKYNELRLPLLPAGDETVMKINRAIENF